MTTINLDGQQYPFPEDLTLDEAILLERHAGITLADLDPGKSLPMGALKAFVVIAVLRANPRETEAAVAARIGDLKIDQLQNLIDEEEPEAAGPPQAEPGDSTETSGGDTSNGSGSSPDGAAPASFGSPDSATTAIFDRKTSAA